jgi:pyruvate dehydrogenase E2 component (dihydrolipoamide acetyltransferase)
MIEFVMPSLGADMEDGTLVKWRKTAGDTVNRGDIIADVETQKGSIEIEIFNEGVIEKLLIEEGTKVPVGTPMALIASKKAMPETNTVVQPVLTDSETHPIDIKSLVLSEERKIKISPLARRIAAEKNIDISAIKGTGENGVITKDDVENTAIKNKAIPEKDKSEVSTEIGRDKDFSKTVRLAVATAMSKSNREIPHYYLEKKIDMSKPMAWLNEANIQRPVRNRLLPAALLIKAVARSLQEVPELNAIWDNDLKIKNEINIGFVVSLRNGGIIVPAIHSADLKTVDEIMVALNDIIPRAKALKLRSSELSDSTITITSIGEGGADTVYGIIYPPQVAIIGFGNISEQPFAEKGMLDVRPVVNVTVAGDHRASDGLTGSRFLVSLNKLLQNPESL